MGNRPEHKPLRKFPYGIRWGATVVLKRDYKGVPAGTVGKVEPGYSLSIYNLKVEWPIQFNIKDDDEIPETLGVPKGLLEIISDD